MSVRIAAHAITAAALLPLAGPAVAGPDTAVVQQVWLSGSPAEIDEAVARFGLGRDHGTTAQGANLYATPAQVDALRAEGWRPHTLRSAPPPADRYQMPDEGTARLRLLAEGAPRAGTVVLGRSVEGRSIEAIWIGQPPESGAPANRVLGAHHGDEYSSFEVALATAEALVAADGTDPAITAALDELTVWVAPYVNPDGVVEGKRWNAHNVDLNRNYDFEWSPDEFLPGVEPFSEPETRAVRAFDEWVQPHLGLSLHSGAANFGWVWNHTTRPADDAGPLQDLALRYLDRTTLGGFWVTNGASWYITHGDTNDWAYGRLGVWDSTIELTEEKAPAASAIDAYVAAHLPAMLDQVTLLPDLSGRVVDEQSGSPVDAWVELLDADGPLGRSFRTQPGTGAFHHMADLPVSDVAITATGYLDQVVPVDAIGEIRLERDQLDGRPLLPIPLYAGDEAELPKPLDGTVTLSRPGYPSRSVPVSFGVLDVDPGELAAGAWTVERPGGVVHRHALLIADRPVSHWSLDGDTLRVESQLHEGARAWALVGEDRARLPLVTLEHADDELLLDATPLVGLEGRVDLWILDAGEHMFVPDILDNSPDTWGFTRGRPKLVGRACACEVKTGHLPGLLGSWIPLLLLIPIRRRR